MKRALKWLIWLVVLGGLGFGGWTLWKKRTEAAALEAQGNTTTVAVAKGKLIVKAQASGVIEAHKKVQLKSRASGEVVEILVKEGQTVAKGDRLVRLDPYTAERQLELQRTNLAQLEAQLAEAKANLGIAQVQAKEARSDAKVQTDGVTMGLVAPTQKRSAKSQSVVAQKTVEQRQAQIARIAAQIDSAKVDVTIAERTLKETETFAPFAGTVLDIAVELGDIVSAGTSFNGGVAMMTLADLSDLRVIGQVDEAQIAKVTKDQTAEIRVDAYPDRAFEGRVETVSLLGVNLSNVVSFAVEFVVTDKDRGLLRPGMSADVDVRSKVLDGVLLVPLTAIITRGPDRFVRAGDGSEKKVVVGPHDGAKIVIVSGLAEGEAIRPIGAAAKSAEGKPSGGLFSPPKGMGRK